MTRSDLADIAILTFKNLLIWQLARHAYRQLLSTFKSNSWPHYWLVDAGRLITALL